MRSSAPVSGSRGVSSRTARRGAADGPASGETGVRPKVLWAVLGSNLAVVFLALWLGPTRSPPATAPSPSIAAAAGDPSPRHGPLRAVAEPEQPPKIIEPAVPWPQAEPVAASVEDRWGVRITGMRLAMGGNGLDLRYKVLDASKAGTLLHLKEDSYVVDQESGKTLPFPLQRESQTSQKLVAGRTYFALLANKDHLVKPGSRVTVAIGNQRQRDVLVE